MRNSRFTGDAVLTSENTESSRRGSFFRPGRELQLGSRVVPSKNAIFLFRSSDHRKESQLLRHARSKFQFMYWNTTHPNYNSWSKYLSAFSNFDLTYWARLRHVSGSIEYFSWLLFLQVPERIRAMNASVRLLLILREPVTRAISDYTQLKSLAASTTPSTKTTAPKSFEQLAIKSDGEVNASYR